MWKEEYYFLDGYMTNTIRALRTQKETKTPRSDTSTIPPSIL